MNPSPLRIILAAIITSLVLLFFHFSDVHASPSAPLEITLTQPDGARFIAVQWGDEWFNGFETPDGHTILVDPETGYWVYAAPKPDGALAPALRQSGILIVGRDNPDNLPLHIRPSAPAQTQVGIASSDLNSPVHTTFEFHGFSGDMKVLVLLAKFTDRSETYPASTFEQLVFGSTGSLKDYYHEVSYGAFNLIPAEETCGVAGDGIAGWSELPYIHPNTGSAITEANLQIVKDVLTANDGCIDYASYDKNLDGGLSPDELQIIVVVAGWERAYSYSTPSVWAHSSILDYIENPVLDGVIIGSYEYGSGYAQIGEIHGTGANQHPATLGILAHEFGHSLNWPDLYDVDGSTEGVGRWSIMGSGGWNQTGLYAGDTPAQPDAWLKWYQGWLAPVEITGRQDDVLIDQVEDHPQAYLLRPNPNGIDWIFNYHTGRGEYFLVENRQQTLSDAGLPGCGLLVWHVYEQLPFNNYANAIETLPLLNLEQADGKNDLLRKSNRGDGGDPFPGLSSNTSFDYSSNPNSRRHDAGVSGVSIQVDSTNCNAVMQADLSYLLYSYILNYITKPDTSCIAWTTIMSEDFEGDGLKNWTLLDQNDAEYGEYFPAKSSCRATSGSNSGWMIGGGADGSMLACGDHYPDHTIPWMIYGPFSTVGETSVVMDFHHWVYIEPAIPYTIYDRFCVWASDDNQVFDGYCFTGDWGGWHEYTFNLREPIYNFYNFLDKPQVWVAFSMMTDDYIHFPEGAYVDDITLRRCIAPGYSIKTPMITSASIPSNTPDSAPLFDPFGFIFSRIQPGMIGPLTITRQDH